MLTREVLDRVAGWVMVDLCPQHTVLVQGSSTEHCARARHERREVLRLHRAGVRFGGTIARMVGIKATRANRIIRCAVEADERDAAP